MRECQHCSKEFEPNKNGARYKYCSEECFKEERRKRNRESMRKANPPKPDVTIKCEWCGLLHIVPPRTAHQARFCSDDCRDTWWSREVYGHRPREEVNQERKIKRIKRERKLNKVRERKRAIRSLGYTLKLVAKEKRVKELTRACDECGETFYDPNPVPLTCSKECSKKRRNRLGRLYMNDRYNKDNLIDKDITLEKLYKRDKGICYICGDKCNYNDNEITKEGYFIAGGTYPSIDHVIPISKGGKHSWNNVKLAHCYCNTIKSDRIIEGNSKALV